MGDSLAGIVYPQWWNYSKDPTYLTGLITDLAFWALSEVLVVAYRWKCIKENKRRDDLLKKGDMPEYDPDLDLTDKQDLYHRYSY
ncbi:hypothetical protein KL921_000004 [Ogataea angusta]|nr:hypothetical protein KL921_000004 [Ogataea angusta]